MHYIVKNVQQGRQAGTATPEPMLGTVHAVFGGKEGRYLFTNDSFKYFTDDRGKGNRPVVTGSSFVARLENRHYSSLLKGKGDKSVTERVSKNYV